MVASLQRIEEALRAVHDQKSFIQKLLVDALGWPIPEEVEQVEDMAYGWSADDLRAQELEEYVKDGQVWQIQPAQSNNVWGVFLLEFKKEKVFTSGRGMVGPLRQVLRGLVPSRRKQAHLQAWDRKHLLFICTHNYKHYRFAYFKAPPEQEKTAPLAAFGWGPGVPARTACEFNLPCLSWPEESLSADEWVQQWAAAFDVEKVTQRFYLDYAKVFDAILPQCGLSDSEEAKLFTQTLLNRLMFLRFLERKGWLTFQKRQDYLRALYEAGPVGKTSFYQGRLLPLFFEALAKPDGGPKTVVGEVPFLNGGLFDPSPLDDKASPLPDSAFAPIIGKDGLFYRYNFTVEESTPLDIEVAVDPEMLGKVFEELITGRHETGSYYTPRPVVAFMCREALKAHLETRSQAPRDAIALLVDQGDASQLSESHARQVLDALDALKAVDPACGSGAYLLGLLQELVLLYRALFSEKLQKSARSLYDLKLRIISNNLYGVDIDPFATNVAMLRLWLSLAVEADTPLPLPNLDFKIESGDALLGPCEVNAEGLFYKALVLHADVLVDLKDKYLKATGKDKEHFRKQILEVEKKMEELAPRPEGDRSIDWRVRFAEVMGRNKGFDIVLANPPYVRQELITDIKDRLKENFPAVYSGTADLYVFFYARGLELLRKGGALSFIAPNKFFRAGYGKKLRSYLAQNTSLRVLIDFADYPIFQAITYPAILVTQKKAPDSSNGHFAAYLWQPEDELNQISALFVGEAASISQSRLAPESWQFQDQRTAATLDKIKVGGTPLGQFLQGRIYRGIVTGNNDAFEIDEETKNELIKEDKKSKEIIKPWLRGRNIGRWSVEWSERYLIFARRGIKIDDYPAIKRYLQQFKKQLQPRPENVPTKNWLGRKPGSYKWYEVQDSIEYWREFEKPKIVYQDIATYQQFAFTDMSYVAPNTTWIIPDPPAGLLGLLNSKVAWFFLDQTVAKVQGGAFRLFSIYMSKLPVANLSKDLIQKEKSILKLAERGEAKSEAGKTLEADIDEIVVRMYGLNREDEQVIDEALAECGNRFPFKETEEYRQYVRTMFDEE